MSSFPARVLRAIGVSAESLTGLGANPHRTLRRWWETAQVLAREHPALARRLVDQLDSALPVNDEEARDFSPMVAAELTSLTAEVVELAIGEVGVADLHRLETVLTDLVLAATSASDSVRKRLREEYGNSQKQQ